MNCPYCKGKKRTGVIDSRVTDEGYVIRRRRECGTCKKRFTTYERIEELSITVIKKDGKLVRFDRSKIINGLLRACEKRPVSTKKLNEIAEDIEETLHNKHTWEINSRDIGQMVMTRLKNIDKVAYIRFASVYLEFDNLNNFIDAVKSVMHIKD